MDIRHSPWRDQILGVDTVVPVLGGRERPYVNLDNAASTPPLKSVVDAVHRFLPWYASVHRGSGFKSKLSTWLYEEARTKVLEFVGADPDRYVVIFVGNTTEAINKLAWHLRKVYGEAAVLTTLMEHHSNDLPWRRCGQLLRLPLDAWGCPQFDYLEDQLRNQGGRIKLVAVTGASNVTGVVTPIHDIARIAHRYGAHVFVDAAQLAPHRRIRMVGDGDGDSAIDFLAFSAHKMYAPFGSGALIARRDLLTADEPWEVGGGTVRVVTPSAVIYANAPESEEAGSPNVVGVLALAAAIDWFRTTGMDAVEQFERELTRAAWKTLISVPGIQLYGPPVQETGPERLGVFAFNLPGWEHGHLAAVLSYEFAIGVRNGCFCAQPYLRAILGLSQEPQPLAPSSGERSSVPGAVRASLGLYNTLEEIEYLANALRDLATGRHKPAVYTRTDWGEYLPKEGGFDARRFCLGRILAQ
ncbi:MAG: aminotransferase class V-fold PLP-dependent enzyme [candidate division KSB1 bacterium]|nr:aminotransferase class V-fold PLP-dependent enzyme [candidate division KSB1 bacterium]